MFFNLMISKGEVNKCWLTVNDVEKIILSHYNASK